MKAFLGMGLLGSHFVRAMRARGEEVQVWNRTASRATTLETYGAKAFEQVEDAVRGADMIHITLKDDASVNDVLEKARPALQPGAILIDHTTTSKEGAIERTAYWKEAGFFYQHAPVFMGPANALEGTGFMLLSGDEALVSRLQPHLAPMTGEILHFGEEVGKAAAMKLVGNAFLVGFATSLRDALTLGKALGTTPADAATLFNSWNPGAQLPARLKRMSSGEYSQPSWELAMARKDTGLFLEAVAAKGLELAAIPGAAALMDSWLAKGYGNHDWTVIAKDVVEE